MMATWVCATCGPVPAGAIRHLDHDSPHGHETHECGSSAGLDWTKTKEHEMTTTRPTRQASPERTMWNDAALALLLDAKSVILKATRAHCADDPWRAEASRWVQRHAAFAGDEDQDDESLFKSHRLADGTMPDTIPVTDSEQDAPDGATIDGYTRQRDTWVKNAEPTAS